MDYDAVALVKITKKFVNQLQSRETISQNHLFQVIVKWVNFPCIDIFHIEASFLQ